MKYRIIIFLLLCNVVSVAQTKKLSIEANYPLPTGHNFLGENYKGIADLGIKYRIKDLQLVTFGIAVNASLLNYKVDGVYSPEFDQDVDFKTNAYIIQPRLFAEFNLKEITKLHPEIGLGYSFFIFKTHFSSGPDIPDESNNESGIDINLGLLYDVSHRVYVRAGYDFIKLTQLIDGVDDTGYNTNLGIIKLGLGLRL